MRTLLFSTSKRGQALESLYISLQRNESRQNFNIWSYGERGSLKIGSGLFVPQEGVAFDHHFLIPEDGSSFDFVEGEYLLSVYAKLINQKAAKKLSEISLKINKNQALELKQSIVGIFFVWGPDKQAYQAHIDKRI